MTPFFVNIPYTMLRSRIDEVIARRLCPEIVLDASTLDGLDKKKARRLADQLQEAGLRCTLHGPSRDLSPGALDPKIRRVTRERIDQAMEIVEVFRPESTVFHSGYDPWKYHGHEKLWLTNCVETWKSAVERAERLGLSLAVENVYEKTPATILSLLQEIGSPYFRYCLDVGHWHVFGSTSLEQWIETMASYVLEIHIHDNKKTWDEHLPIEEGTIDFSRFFRLIHQYVPITPIYTLEPEREEDLEPSIRGFLKALGKTRNTAAPI